MGGIYGCGNQEMGVIKMWLVGAVVRRYIDFLI